MVTFHLIVAVLLPTMGLVQGKPSRTENPYVKDCYPVSCPEDINNMYFVHPKRCDAFCQCSNGVPHEMPCPSGLIFNPDVIPGPVCDYPQNYDCTIGQGAGDCTDITCPGNLEDMYFPHPATCSAFCQCSNGVPYEMPCPPGLVYDPNLVPGPVCVRPHEYECPVQGFWSPIKY